ncbi:hypothetical protein Tco_0452993 [Tanacetum coccineum]
MDSDSLRQIYVPKLNVVNESFLDDPDMCRSFVDQLAPWTLFPASWYGLRSAIEVIRLHNQVSIVNAAEVARVSELNSLKERNIALEKEKNTLEGQVMALESMAVTKDTELASLNAQTAKLTQDLSSLQLSCDELSIKADSIESQRDGLIDQVSLLETTCSGLRDQVSGYGLFKELCEAIQDEQVKELSDRVAGLDSKLMALALYLDEELYPRFLVVPVVEYLLLDPTSIDRIP